MRPVLDIADLSIAANGKTLLDKVSLSIAPGERVGLIGESGSGKSLTALAAIGLLAPGLTATGAISLDGQDVIGASERSMVSLRGNVTATVFQEPLTALDPLQPVGRQIAEPLRRRLRRDGEAAGRTDVAAGVQNLLAQVALPDPLALSRRYPHELSGGQRQRVAIAMALACRPQLLIADEPTTALDVTTQAEILRLLAKLVADNGMALLFISHDLPVVARVVDRVVVMQHGVVVEAGPVGEVFSRPQHDYTRSLVAAARSFDGALEGAA
ncbi:ATP-binding cassette domain-containing protein [Devosia aquimaris]|uniref:ATP-binding cassette domain-containing protein n=1 Tax=Devosia aquimaris TaxID=2866214 RepID=UPI001CD17967|nr:ABC transporter ATP-binding protein [Devosia sp. CJK-A8-3]